jgi:HEAT repeat protein
MSIAALMVVSLLQPTQESAPASRPAEAPASRPAIRVLADEEARQAVARFEQTARKKLDMGQKMQAVEDLAQGAHPRIVRTLDAVLKKEPVPSVRLAAARALADQPPKESRQVILAAIKDKKNDDQPQVLEALVRSLDRASYESGDVELLARLFDRGEATLQKAIIQCFGNHAEKEAVKLLLENLDEPIPAEVQPLHNPPASYWEKRWKAWKAWLPDLKEALKTITGQEFQDSKTAKNWLRQNGARIGVTRF